MDQNINEFAWPPTYKLKRKPYLRAIKLKISSTHGLEIITAQSTSINKIHTLLEEHKNWIIEKLLQIEKKKNCELPQNIVLNALQKKWDIHYIIGNNKKLKLLERPQAEIVLWGDINNKDNCLQQLIVWLKNQAKMHLLPKLQEISTLYQLPFNSVSIRRQVTRWGSCNSHKEINLNYKLLFLPSHLVKHILIHELCHTKHLNHSSSFWKLVKKYDTYFEQNKRELKHANKYIPEWIE